MTWSIIARDNESGAIGIASASKAFAVGKQVPFIESQIGAVATQALVNPHYGPRGLALIRNGMAADDVVKQLIGSDEGRTHRQLHVLDTAGKYAAYTGPDCIPYAGHLITALCSVAGNMLAGPAVLEATAARFASSRARNFALRLIDAMRAGEEAGGDKRGKQSASVLIYSTEEYSDLELRADDHTDPLTELERLEHVSRQKWVHQRAYLPSRRNPVGETDRRIIDAGILAAVAKQNAEESSP